MTRPSSAAHIVQAGLIQTAARVRLEIVHHPFGRRFRLYYQMNMIRTHVSGEQIPFVPRTPLPYSSQDDRAARSVQAVRRLTHSNRFRQHASVVESHQRRARQVVPSVNRASLLAVEMAAIARERDQIRHKKNIGGTQSAPYGRGSVCRGSVCRGSVCRGSVCRATVVGRWN